MNERREGGIGKRRLRDPSFGEEGGLVTRTGGPIAEWLPLQQSILAHEEKEREGRREGGR